MDLIACCAMDHRIKDQDGDGLMQIKNKQNQKISVIRDDDAKMDEWHSRELY